MLYKSLPYTTPADYDTNDVIRCVRRLLTTTLRFSKVCYNMNMKQENIHAILAEVNKLNCLVKGYLHNSTTNPDFRK